MCITTWETCGEHKAWWEGTRPIIATWLLSGWIKATLQLGEVLVTCIERCRITTTLFNATRCPSILPGTHSLLSLSRFSQAYVCPSKTFLGRYRSTDLRNRTIMNWGAQSKIVPVHAGFRSSRQLYIVTVKLTTWRFVLLFSWNEYNHAMQLLLFIHGISCMDSWLQ